MSSTLYCKVNPLQLLLRLPRIAPGEAVPSNDHQVKKHLDAVTKHVHLGSGRVPPAHGNFHGAQSMMPRQVEKLGIETEALDALLFEKNAAALAAKCLESALRIDERQAQNDAHDG